MSLYVYRDFGYYSIRKENITGELQFKNLFLDYILLLVQGRLSGRIIIICIGFVAICTSGRYSECVRREVYKKTSF